MKLLALQRKGRLTQTLSEKYLYAYYQGQREEILSTYHKTTKKDASRQRSALQKFLARVVLDELIPVLMSDESDCRLCFVEKIVAYASSYSIKRNELKEIILSDSIHNAALSLIKTFGAIGGNHDPEFSDVEKKILNYEFWRGLIFIFEYAGK